jgi:Flp pilus assembly protein TadG
MAEADPSAGCGACGGDQGATLVEFAVILPVLGVMLMAAVDFGRLVATSVALSNAVKAGVQYGAQSTAASASTTGMTAAARADFQRDRLRHAHRRQRQGALPLPRFNGHGDVRLGEHHLRATPQAYVVVGAQRSVD